MNILLIARAPIPSVILCAQAPLEALARTREVSCRYAAPEKVSRKDLLWADLAVFIRSDTMWEASLAKLAEKAGIGTVYVLDDDLLNAPAWLSSGEFYSRESTKTAIRAVMAACRGFLTPSPVLLEKYSPGFESAGLIEEPAILPSSRPEKEHDGPVVVGFAGSVDRTGDVDALLDAALRRLLDRYGDRVRLEFFGACPALAAEGRARHIPYRESYEEYRGVMETLAWDIALAPMPDTSFHRCKHYNKYIEYAACGLPGVYSDVPVYRRAVRSGENGLLAANTADAWFDALCRLVENEELRRSLGENARREAETVYSPEACGEKWAAYLDALPPRERREEALRGFALLRRAELLRQTGEKLRFYGWRAPARAADKLLTKLKGKRS